MSLHDTWIQCIGARAHTNNLPLALVPIMHNPKTEGSNLANLDISSLDDLTNEMVPPEYVFGPLV